MSHLTPSRKSGPTSEGHALIARPATHDTHSAARAFARAALFALLALAPAVARAQAAGAPVHDPHTSPHTDPHTRPHTAPHVDPHTRPHTDPHTRPHVEPHTLPHAQHADAESGATAVMSGAMIETPHLRLTPPRAATAADSARARAIAADLKRAVARYAQVDSAVADGYEQFAPQLKQQRVFHFTKKRHAFRNEFGFDAARPTSLLYSRDERGGMRLVGAMYTAPRRSSLEQLDGRVPLGIAQWHLHTNICVPKRRERERWSEIRDGTMVFGLLSPIATEEACDAVGGRFHEAVFNWMVHANFGADGSVTWGDDHAMHGAGSAPATGAGTGHVH